MDRSAFVWDEFSWRTRIHLPTEGWTPGYAHVYTSRVPRSLFLYFAPEGRDDHPLDDAEIASVAWTVANLPRLMDSLQSGLFTYHQAICANADGPLAKDLTALDRPDEWKPLMSIESVYVHQISKDGKPYVGFEATCWCDAEHGLGVLMHDTHIVEVGGADTAVLLWIAEDDSKRIGEVDTATRS
ncbi:DUF6985 domain-containing protein [Streptomyces collinus]|uniref:DUF6985 domain-containing protein n=1 Tax=Streptomyces collinus TaxID=42684 RepID=UPI00368B1CDD